MLDVRKLTMRAEAEDKGKLRFRVGVILIVVNYVLWAASFVFAALALRGTDFPWLRVAATSFVLSWMLFLVGILLAGREAVRYIRAWAVRIFKTN